MPYRGASADTPCLPPSDLCKLTSLPPAGLLCEIVKPDDEMGSMARRDDCWAFARQWGFKMISVDQIREAMEAREGPWHSSQDENIDIK